MSQRGEKIPVIRTALVERPFLIPVQDVFSLSGRGTVATGRIEQGRIKAGDEVEIVGLHPTIKTVVTGIKGSSRKLSNEGAMGENVGLLLRGTKREQVWRGQVLAKPGSISPHTRFKADACMLAVEEGGRQAPFPSNYRLQFSFWTTHVDGVAELPLGVEMPMPGSNMTMEVTITTPVALAIGTPFALLEDGRTVGEGVVRQILSPQKDAEKRWWKFWN
jgi:elongation factor Tu